MAYDARVIADWFIERARQEGRLLTQMKLQKLVYIAHGWHLALTSEPLVQDNIEAWRWGPVVRALYSEFAIFGASPIPRASIIRKGAKIDNKALTILERVWELYGKYTAAQLSAMTHADNTPWKECYQPSAARPAIIPNSLIRKHYLELAESRHNERIPRP